MTDEPREQPRKSKVHVLALYRALHPEIDDPPPSLPQAIAAFAEHSHVDSSDCVSRAAALKYIRSVWGGWGQAVMRVKRATAVDLFDRAWFGDR